MNKNTRGILGAILSIAAAIGAVAGAMVFLYKVVKKHFKFTVELFPDGIENEEAITSAVDVHPEMVKEEEPETDEEEFEISFIEEEEEEKPAEEEADEDKE